MEEVFADESNQVLRQNTYFSSTGSFKFSSTKLLSHEMFSQTHYIHTIQIVSEQDRQARTDLLFHLQPDNFTWTLNLLGEEFYKDISKKRIELSGI